MARTDVIAFRVEEDERRLLLSLAVALERNASDTIRFLLREAARARGLLGEAEMAGIHPLTVSGEPRAGEGQGP